MSSDGWQKIKAGEYERDGWLIVKYRNGPPAQWKLYQPCGDGHYLTQMHLHTLTDAKIAADKALKTL